MPNIVTTTQAKQFLRITHDAQDAVLAILLEAVSEWITQQTGIEFAGTTYSTVTDDLDGGGYSLWPSRSPIRSVTSITDRDTSVGLASDVWRNDQVRIWRRDGERWQDGSGLFRVIYTAGYKSTETPADLKLLALQIISRAYSRRGGLDSNSSAGYGENWQELVTSDESVRLRQYRHGGMMG